MGSMFYAREVFVSKDGVLSYGPPKTVELIPMSYVPGVPEKPEPGPDDPPLSIWGPGDPRPTHPIAGFDPIHGTWPKPPVGEDGQPLGKVVIVRKPPENLPPPAELDVQASWVLVTVEKGSPPVWGKLNPYAATVPGAPAKQK